MTRLLLLLVTLTAFGTPHEAEAKAVRTARSDGASFRATKVEPVRQVPREVTITRSRSALPAKGTWYDKVEPVEGGLFVAPAGSAAESEAPHVILDLRTEGRHTQLPPPKAPVRKNR